MGPFSVPVVLLPFFIIAGLLLQSGDSQNNTSPTPTKVYVKLLPSKRSTVGRQGIAAILRTVKNNIHTAVDNLYSAYGGEVSGMNPAVLSSLGAAISKVMAVSNKPAGVEPAPARFEQVVAKRDIVDRTASELNSILDEEKQIQSQLSTSARDVPLTVDKDSLQIADASRFEKKKGTNAVSPGRHSTIALLDSDTATTEKVSSENEPVLGMGSATVGSGLGDGPIAPRPIQNNPSDSFLGDSLFSSKNKEAIISSHFKNGDRDFQRGST